MPTLSMRRLSGILALLTVTLAMQAQDFHIKKNISVGGNFVSSTDTSIKGARERTVSQSPTGNTITLRQCDLKRTVTINEQTQTYFVASDPQDDAALKAAAMMGGGPAADSGPYITETSSITDTGERKTMYGYPARHLKAKVDVKSSDNACTQMNQQYELDGWYADVSKDLAASCQQFLPPVRQNDGCNDRVIRKRSGSAKPGYPLAETVTLHNADGSTTAIGVQTAEISKAPLEKELFDVPAGYTEVKSMAELKTGPKPAAPAPALAATQPAQQTMQAAAQPPAAGKPKKKFGFGQLLSPAAAATSQTAAVAQAAQYSKAGGAAAAMQGVSSVQNTAAAQGVAQSAAAMQGIGGAQSAAGMQAMAQMKGMQGMQGMQGMGAQQNAGMPAAMSQPLGPKAKGKIRIGVAPPDAQVGQGTNSGGDFSTPIRNAEVALMSGPAIEIAPLDSHIAMQLQAEAQQKQCDYIMYSGVVVKHGQSGGFGKFMKMGSMAANLTPMGAMSHMGGLAAAQAASMAASQMAQQQAVNQLAGFNGQIKSKDDVSVQYQLVPTGQTTPMAQNTLQGKAKSDGEDVLTPLLTQAATEVLTQVSKK